MQITAELIESLLWEPEGTALDFKSEQYPFANATTEQKGELLKDILALANAFRREDAFILIGVKEVKGGKAEVVGLSEQLEDAHVQQFVSGNVQRPLTFSYRGMDHDGKKIGVIHIPRQKRPFHTKVDYGKLKKGVVYVRRGSSTAVAMPDEIAAMGADHVSSTAAEPILEFSLFDRASGKKVGDLLNLNCLVLNAPPEKDIPDYRTHDDPYRIGLDFSNSSYYRQLAEFTCFTRLVQPVSLSITNAGDVTAMDVRLVFEIDDDENVLYLCDEAELPVAPKSQRTPLDHMGTARLASVNQIVTVSRTSTTWKVECLFGKIQPKDTVQLAEELYAGSVESKSVPLELKLFADNLSRPVVAKCQLNFDAELRDVTLDDIKALEFERFSKTPKGKSLLEEVEEARRKG